MFQNVQHLRQQGRIADALFHGGAGDGGQSDGHTLAVQDGEIAARLYRVADGVAQIQQGALTAVEFIVLHHVPLHAHAGGNDRLKLLPDGGGFQLLKQLRAEENRRFDDLGAACPVFGIRQGFQQRRVAQHQSGVCRTSASPEK